MAPRRTPRAALQSVGSRACGAVEGGVTQGDPRSWIRRCLMGFGWVLGRFWCCSIGNGSNPWSKIAGKWRFIRRNNGIVGFVPHFVVVLIFLVLLDWMNFYGRDFGDRGLAVWRLIKSASGRTLTAPNLRAQVTNGFHGN